MVPVGPRPEPAPARALGRPAANGALLHAHLPAPPRRDRAGRRARPAGARPAEADRGRRAGRSARGHAAAPGGAVGSDDAGHLRPLGRLGHVRRRVRRARRAPFLGPGRRPRGAGGRGIRGAGGDRARRDRRARLHAPGARGDPGAALPLPRPGRDPRRRVPLRPHRLPLPGRRPQRRHVQGAWRQRLPQLARGAAPRAGPRPVRHRTRPRSRSSRRSSSSSRAWTAGRRSWRRRSRPVSASRASCTRRRCRAPRRRRSGSTGSTTERSGREPSRRAEGAAVWIRWSRPERLNAWDGETLAALGGALAEAGESDARAIVLHGEGGAFSAGDDLRETATLTPEEWAARSRASTG